MTHTCPSCGETRNLSKAQISRIKNGHRSGLCYGCSGKMRTRPAIERFLKRLNITDTCWEWDGPRNDRGYGVFPFKRERSNAIQSHKFLWEYINGPVPDGLELDHLCMNKACCRPSHLEAVTGDENKHRWSESVRARKVCAAGHEFTEANTYVHPVRGTKRCRRCRADAEASRRIALATRHAIEKEAS